MARQEVPVNVDAEAANAVYNNGVLVIVLPLADVNSSDQIRMEKTGTAGGRRVRHIGNPVRRAG